MSTTTYKMTFRLHLQQAFKKGRSFSSNVFRIATGRNRAACVWVAYNAAVFVSLRECRRKEIERRVWVEYPPQCSYRHGRRQIGWWEEGWESQTIMYLVGLPLTGPPSLLKHPILHLCILPTSLNEGRGS